MKLTILAVAIAALAVSGCKKSSSDRRADCADARQIAEANDADFNFTQCYCRSLLNPSADPLCRG